MNAIQTANKRQTCQESARSDSSTDLQAKNKRERMKEFKRLSLKKNSFVQHLLNCHIDQQIKQLSATQFRSQKWDFKPILQKNEKNSEGASCKIDHNNPFERAKQNYMSKQKLYGSSRLSQKEIDEPTVELADDKTTFRLIKRRSLNEVVNASNKQQF